VACGSTTREAVNAVRKTTDLLGEQAIKERGAAWVQRYTMSRPFGNEWPGDFVARGEWVATTTSCL